MDSDRGLPSETVSNVLSEEKQKQVIALGQLGWSLRRIEKSTGIRRETAGGYLRAANIPVRPPGAWGKRPAAKPANGVTTDSADCSKPANAVTADSAGEQTAKPANVVTTDSSISAAYRELIEEGISHQRNAMSIWQQLVDRHGFAGSYESVKRFVRKLRGGTTAVEARCVIETAPGEDYGESGVMVRAKRRRLRVRIAGWPILRLRAFHNAGW